MAHAVVGLGNPGPKYEGTRHNVGHRVLDALTPMVRASWRREGPALVGRGRWRDEMVYLVKPTSFMNEAGPPVAATLRRLGLAAPDVILVHDDIDLALGQVRVRMKGSPGGHNGVRSVIETLGTEDIRRVKVGVGRPERKEEVVDHVLTPFEPDEVPVVEAAVAAAAERVLGLVYAASRM